MRTAVFCDTQSLYQELRNRFQKRLNYCKYLNFLKEELRYDPVIKIAYGNQKATVIHKFISDLNWLGFQTHFKFNKDWHVEMVLNIVSITDKVDCVVLGTSDPIFAPVIPWVEAHGVKIHIVSCGIPGKLSELALCHEIHRELLDEAPDTTQ